MDIFTNNFEPKVGTLLSIASPYFGDDPSVWVNNLVKNINSKNVQIILIDDGTNNDDLDKKIKAAISKWPGPALRIKLEKNLGRANARNLAIKYTIGEYILFIDADMVPFKEDYLDKYLEHAQRKSAAIIFGGFVNSIEKIDPDYELHFDLAKHGDCLPAKLRARRGAYAVASNNLMALKKVFEQEPFDINFKGWGWEDTEWAIRAVNKGFGLLHIDNEAIHWGLDNTQTMLNKYREAGVNLALMVKKHPIANKFLAIKIANIIGKIPFHQKFRPIAQFIVIDKYKIIPIFIRRMAIKFWRASWAAQSLKNQ